ncbi:MAG: preprotein translocase subunit SecG [Gammaproteobacteria bacterium]|nr:preprotein translocase subunit SecG [Gammaproteobacteria bacterium]
MELFLLISLLIVALLLIGIILIQQGKGAEMGASFGAGASNTLFGAPGAGNFLTKSTTILAILFFVIALSISWIKKRTSDEAGIADEAAKLNQTTTEVSTEPSLNAIPAEVDNTATEIPTQAVETISTEIPTGEEVKAAADKAVDTVEQKAEEAKKDLADKATEVKTDAEKKLEEAKKKAEEEIKEKTDGDK